MDESVPTTLSRPAVSLIAKSLSKLSNDLALEVGIHAIDKLSHRHVSFEEEVSFKVNLIGCKFQEVSFRNIRC